ncbi:LysR family transcriptional regulator [Actinomadura sp. DC4]|uniref:LysR family transcriptional regulator n=1 Tax=Actinomadura sp. DC4 TaxID=3055069 RepID=UPI0025B27F00|nr:LysR family transcriptional regulator [Actinomadura sp. DC4]MDN3354070.1 LysR family transcriptional regulator [Actinomadura sp. DC4]
MDVRRLRIFSTVVEHGSVTAAAKALFMTPSAVSQQLALLERQLGLALVTRGPRGVEPTGAGRLLAERSVTLLAGVARLEHEMRDLGAARVRLAVFPAAGADLVPRVVRACRRRFPDVRVELRSVPAADMASRLRDGSVHLGLVWDYDFAPRTFAADLERIPLGDDPLYVLFPADHPLAAERRVRLADLAGERWVVRGHRPPYDEAFAEMCRLSGFKPDVGFVTEDYQAAQGMVAAGIGISAVPRMSLASRRPDVVAVPMAGPARCRRIAVLRAPGADRPQAAEGMLTVLRDDLEHAVA